MIRAKVIFNSGHEQVIECAKTTHAFNGLEIFHQVNTASGEKMSVAIPVKEIGLIEYTEAEPNVHSENQDNQADVIQKFAEGLHITANTTMKGESENVREFSGI